MATEFLHGIEVLESDSRTRVIKTAKSSVIGIIVTAPDADESIFPSNKLVLVTGTKVT